MSSVHPRLERLRRHRENIRRCAHELGLDLGAARNGAPTAAADTGLASTGGALEDTGNAFGAVASVGVGGRTPQSPQVSVKESSIAAASITPVGLTAPPVGLAVSSGDIPSPHSTISSTAAAIISPVGFASPPVGLAAPSGDTPSPHSTVSLAGLPLASVTVESGQLAAIGSPSSFGSSGSKFEHINTQAGTYVTSSVGVAPCAPSVAGHYSAVADILRDCFAAADHGGSLGTAPGSQSALGLPLHSPMDTMQLGLLADVAQDANSHSSPATVSGPQHTGGELDGMAASLRSSSPASRQSLLQAIESLEAAMENGFPSAWQEGGSSVYEGGRTGLWDTLMSPGVPSNVQSIHSTPAELGPVVGTLGAAASSTAPGGFAGIGISLAQAGSCAIGTAATHRVPGEVHTPTLTPCPTGPSVHERSGTLLSTMAIGSPATAAASSKAQAPVPTQLIRTPDMAFASILERWRNQHESFQKLINDAPQPEQGVGHGNTAELVACARKEPADACTLSMLAQGDPEVLLRQIKHDLGLLGSGTKAEAAPIGSASGPASLNAGGQDHLDLGPVEQQVGTRHVADFFSQFHKHSSSGNGVREPVEPRAALTPIPALELTFGDDTVDVARIREVASLLPSENCSAGLGEALINEGGAYPPSPRISTSPQAIGLVAATDLAGVSGSLALSLLSSSASSVFGGRVAQPENPASSAPNRNALAADDGGAAEQAAQHRRMESDAVPWHIPPSNIEQPHQQHGVEQRHSARTYTREEASGQQVASPQKNSAASEQAVHAEEPRAAEEFATHNMLSEAPRGTVATPPVADHTAAISVGCSHPKPLAKVDVGVDTSASGIGRVPDLPLGSNKQVGKQAVATQTGSPQEEDAVAPQSVAGAITGSSSGPLPELPHANAPAQKIEEPLPPHQVLTPTHALQNKWSALPALPPPQRHTAGEHGRRQLAPETLRHLGQIPAKELHLAGILPQAVPDPHGHGALPAWCGSNKHMLSSNPLHVQWRQCGLMPSIGAPTSNLASQLPAPQTRSAWPHGWQTPIASPWAFPVESLSSDRSCNASGEHSSRQGQAEDALLMRAYEVYQQQQLDLLRPE